VLELRSVSARYGQVQVLWDVSLTVGEGELVCLLGGNASGKSTTIKTIIGLVHPVAGEILWEGRPIQRRTPAEVVRAGIAPVLESRRIFPDLTVHENLLMGAYTRDRRRRRPDRPRASLDAVPRARRAAPSAWRGAVRRRAADARHGPRAAGPAAPAGDGRAVHGLSPLYVDRIFDIIQGLNRDGIGILLVEQNANMALSIAARGYVLQNGRIVLHDTAQNLVNNPMMRKAYLEL
jgi:branched-chain amino acid transport system ATP-binding protein